MSVKVCLITGATGSVGQHVLRSLVSSKQKVLALGEINETFDNFTNKSKIKVTTALPIKENSFKKYDVQFCFGDISDISFLASIFSTAHESNIEIEYVLHIGAYASNNQSSTYKDYGAIANMLEVTKAYWQSNPQTFKGFFYASSNNKIASLIQKMQEKEGFPAEIYQSSSNKYLSNTKSSALLYRIMSPVRTSLHMLSYPKKAENRKEDELSALWGAISNFITKQN